MAADEDQRASAGLHSTNDLIAYWARHSDLPYPDLELAIGAGIDAVYAMRDCGGNMHTAGAAAAVAALEAVR